MFEALKDEAVEEYRATVFGIVDGELEPDFDRVQRMLKILGITQETLESDMKMLRTRRQCVESLPEAAELKEKAAALRKHQVEIKAEDLRIRKETDARLAELDREYRELHSEASDLEYKSEQIGKPAHNYLMRTHSKNSDAERSAINVRIHRIQDNICAIRLVINNFPSNLETQIERLQGEIRYWQENSHRGNIPIPDQIRAKQAKIEELQGKQSKIAKLEAEIAKLQADITTLNEENHNVGVNSDYTNWREGQLSI